MRYTLSTSAKARASSTPRTVIANIPFLEQNPMSISVMSTRVGAWSAASYLHRARRSYQWKAFCAVGGAARVHPTTARDENCLWTNAVDLPIFGMSRLNEEGLLALVS